MPTIGESLREAREKKKINIDVAAKAVKVKTEVLEHIEENDFSSFAAPVYARGIIRLYAVFLGLEPETLVQEYLKLQPSGKQRLLDDLSPEEREQALERRRSVVISTLSKSSDLSPRGVAALVGVVVFLGISIWVLSSSRKPKPEPVQPLAPQMSDIRKPAEAGPSLIPPPAAEGAVLPLSGITNAPGTNAVPALELKPSEQP